LSEALDHAALGESAMSFYNARGDREYSMGYTAIRKRAIELARNLLGLGLSRGDLVAIVAEMHPDFICAYFACHYAGLLAVPLPVATGLGGSQGYQDQLATILKTCGAKIALGPTFSLDHLNRAAQKTDVKFVKTVDMLAEGTRSNEVLHSLGKDDVCHIQFSSGSTRVPMGIEINQKAIMANARSIAVDALNVGPDDRVASWLPFYHDMGLVGCMIVPVTCQASVDYLYTESFVRRPTQWLRIISENRCTVSFSPGFGYDICSRPRKGINFSDFDLSHWRVAGIGGDMIRADIIKRFCDTYSECGFRASSMLPSYGLAEATLAFSFGELGDGVMVDYVDSQILSDEGLAQSVDRDVEGLAADEIRAVTCCGNPLPGFAMQIRSESGKELADREVGGVFIAGPSLMTGYHQNVDATHKCLDDHGWLDTGDMGYVANGNLYITGRKKDMIIINGRNIWPQDLEWYAEQGVVGLRTRDTAAFALAAPDGREEVVILVHCRTNDLTLHGLLKKQVRSVIFTRCGVDCRVETIPNRSLPFTTSGKLQRGKAKELWLAGDYKFESKIADKSLVS